MKILLLATYFYPYEEAREHSDGVHLASSPPEIAKKLSEKHEVAVIARRTEYSERRSVQNKVEVSRVSFWDFAGLRLLSWVLSAFLEILRSNRKRKYDVILCWDWSTALPAVLAKPFIRLPVVCSVRNQSQAYGHKKSVKFPFYYILERFVFNRSNFIVYSSLWVKKTLNNVIKIDRPSKVLHHGIDLKKFNPEVESRVSKEIGLEGFVVGFFGRLVREKGVYVLMRAFAEFSKATSASLLVVGDGSEINGLKSLSRELGAEKNTHFTGFVHRNKIPEYMQACDVIVLPSKAEGFSSVVLEALAMGKVFLGTDVGGVPEMIENWKNGIKIKVDDVDDIRNVLERLSKDKKLMKKIGRNAYEYVLKEDYSWDKYIGKWEKLLQSVVKVK